MPKTRTKIMMEPVMEIIQACVRWLQSTFYCACSTVSITQTVEITILENVCNYFHCDFVTSSQVTQQDWGSHRITNIAYS